MSTVPSSTSTSVPSSSSVTGSFTSPSHEQLTTLSMPIVSSLLPEPQELQAIAQGFIAAGIPAANVTLAALDLVNVAYDSGSSREAKVPGTLTGTQIPRSKLLDVITSHTTFRKFCRYFAKLIWNVRISQNLPPASWEAQNFKEDQKFAAFDFFDGVLNEAALKPDGGLIRKPSEAEIIANQTNRSIHLFESQAQRSNLATTATQLTRGRLDSQSPQVQLLPPPE